MAYDPYPVSLLTRSEAQNQVQQLREHNDRLQKLVETRTAEREEAIKASRANYEKAENAARVNAALAQQVETMRENRDQAIKQRFDAEDRLSTAHADWRELKQQLDTAISFQAITNESNNRLFFRQSRENEKLSTRLMHARALVKHQCAQLQRESECSASWRQQVLLVRLWGER